MELQFKKEKVSKQIILTVAIHGVSLKTAFNNRGTESALYVNTLYT